MIETFLHHSIYISFVRVWNCDLSRQWSWTVNRTCVHQYLCKRWCLCPLYKWATYYISNISNIPSYDDCKTSQLGPNSDQGGWNKYDRTFNSDTVDFIMSDLTCRSIEVSAMNSVWHLKVYIHCTCISILKQWHVWSVYFSGGSPLRLL